MLKDRVEENLFFFLFFQWIYDDDFPLHSIYIFEKIYSIPTTYELRIVLE